MSFPSWDRPNKNIVRKITSPTGFRKNTLWMPGEQMIDFGNALILDRKIGFDGHHILVERDKGIAAKIKSELDKMGVWEEYPYVHERELCTLNFAHPLDYVHLDFCGGLTESNAHWIRNNLLLEKNAEVYFNFTHAARNNSFFDQCEYLIKTDEELKKLMRDEENILDRDDKRIAVFYVLLRSLLRNYKFVVHEQPHLYCDIRYNMVTFCFRGFKLAKEPTYPDVLNKLIMAKFKVATHMPVSMSKALYLAKNPIEKTIAIQNINQHVKKQKSLGFCVRQVKAGIKAQISKLRNKCNLQEIPNETQ